jgi:hypothetical protein
VTAADRTPTQFQAGVNQVAWLLIRFMFVMTPLVLFINGVTKGEWLQALLFALSIAVGLTPEICHEVRYHDLLRDVVRVRREPNREQTLFQSGWFVVGLLTQTLIVHMNRTSKSLSFKAAPQQRWDNDRAHHRGRHLHPHGPLRALFQAPSAAALAIRS